jgi:catechol 2,3-dioxygenase-like lactoylglutathione lyase family enzyme
METHMALKIEGVTHWSIPVNNLDESEAFYGGLLGLEHIGRLGNSVMSCYAAGDNRILLCERDKPGEPEPRVHHSLTVSPETLVEACKLFKEKKVDVIELIYRAKGTFTGRELYFNDPSGNRLELRDPTWHEGMPQPSYDELAAS